MTRVEGKNSCFRHDLALLRRKTFITPSPQKCLNYPFDW